MNFSTFDLNLLRVFNALMRERSATRAGEQVGLSQPAVSAALNRLRYLLDDKLFVRQGNEMIPTPRAQSLSIGVQDALEGLEHLFSKTERFDPRALVRNFTLMGSDFFAVLFVPRLVHRLAENSGRVTLRFLDTARGDVERLLADDAVDMAMEGPLETPEWIEQEVLFTSGFKIILSADHPALAQLRGLTAMPFEVVSELNWALRASDGSLRGYIDSEMEKVGRKRRVVLAMPHFAPLVDCVASSSLAAAIPSQFATAYAQPRGLRVFDLPFPSPALPINLYWHSRRTRDPAHAWLRAMVHELCKTFTE